MGKWLDVLATGGLSLLTKMERKPDPAAQQEIERLQEERDSWETNAIDAIQQAEARAETAEAERAEAIKERDEARALSCVQCAADLDEARAERDRLREALKELEDGLQRIDYYVGVMMDEKRARSGRLISAKGLTETALLIARRAASTPSTPEGAE